MSNIYTSAEQLIGRTPLLELSHIEKEYKLKAKIIAKLEYWKRNPITYRLSTDGRFFAV